MDWVMVSAAVISVWVAATLLGHERQRRIESLVPTENPPPAAPPAHH